MARTVAERLLAAMNAHDLDAFADCFAEDYDSRQPAHPDRAFRGPRAGAGNWAAIFEGVPDFRAELVRVDVAGEVEWSEWAMHGTHADGSALSGGRDRRGRARRAPRVGAAVRGAGRRAGAGIDAAVRSMAGD